jgi:hypothetical protein
VAAQQLQYISGQNVAPYFEGWEQNSDGTFNMVFGYLNRNYSRRAQYSSWAGEPDRTNHSSADAADLLLSSAPSVSVSRADTERLGQEGRRLDDHVEREDPKSVRQSGA